jgi:hypothetical protein
MGLVEGDVRCYLDETGKGVTGVWKFGEVETTRTREKEEWKKGNRLGAKREICMKNK